jgi:hypothetical protein
MNNITETEDMDFSKWSNVVLKLGFPIVVSGLLIWFLLFTVSAKLVTVEKAIEAQAIESRELRNSIDSLKNTVGETRNETFRSNLILQQICVNGTVARDRVNCFR